MTYDAPSDHGVVLLGAGSDIGRAIFSRLIATPGIEVLAVSRRARDGTARETPGVEWLDGIDLADEGSLAILSDAVEKKYSRPFSVVHSIGDFWIHKPLVETDFSEIQSMFRSQVLTLFGAARYLTPHMIKNGGGRIVAFSCNSVTYSYPDMSPFTASKAAIESFVKCYSHEHLQFGVSACALALPTIRTPTVIREKPNGDHDNYLTPEKLADIIVGEIMRQSPEIAGNVVKLVKHSPTFYHTSYYERNPRRPAIRSADTAEE